MDESRNTTGAVPVRLRLNYSSLGDLLVAQIGEPGLAHLVPLQEGFVVYARRKDPLDLVGFELREFSARYPLLDRAWLRGLLGAEVSEALDRLHYGLPAPPPDLDELGEEEFAQALKDSNVRVEAEVVAPGPQIRSARREALRDWSADPERLLQARGDPGPSGGEDKGKDQYPRHLIAAGLLEVEIEVPDPRVSADFEGEGGDERLVVQADETLEAGAWVRLKVQGDRILVAPLRWHDRRKRNWASLELEPASLRVDLMSPGEVLGTHPQHIRDSIERSNHWTRESWRRALVEFANRSDLDVTLEWRRVVEDALKR